MVYYRTSKPIRSIRERRFGVGGRISSNRRIIILLVGGRQDLPVVVVLVLLHLAFLWTTTTTTSTTSSSSRCVQAFSSIHRTNYHSRTIMKLQHSTMMSSSSSSSWWDRPAILWDDTDINVINEGRNLSCYWDPDILEQLSNASKTSCRIPSSTSASSTTTNNTSYISYRLLVPLLYHLIQRLKGDIHKEQDVDLELELESNNSTGIQLPETECDNDDNDPSNKNKNNKGPKLFPIAIAIPDGPLLPLAVLLVHVLNYHPSLISSSKQNTTSYILVPLEPNEGQDRLMDMIQDIQPRMILACGERTIHQLENILAVPAAAATVKEDTIITTATVVVDFKDWVQDALQEYYHSKQTSVGLLLFDEGIENLLPTTVSSNQDENLPMLLLQFSDAVDKSSSKPSSKNIDSTTTTTTMTNNLLPVTTTTSNNNNENKINNDKITTRAIPPPPSSSSSSPFLRISHIVFTSGTTGRPKGCISSLAALIHYIHVKNGAHDIKNDSIVFLASSLSFDPCLSDILATIGYAKATLALTPKRILLSGGGSGSGGSSSHVLRRLEVSHVLCTPTIWSILTQMITPHQVPSLRVIALGGEPIPSSIRQVWARSLPDNQNVDRDSEKGGCRLFATYGVTEACVYQTMGEIFRLKDKTTNDTTYSTDTDNKVRQQRLEFPSVGRPFDGLGVRICVESEQTCLVDVPSNNTNEMKEGSSDIGVASAAGEVAKGEIILYGAQVDSLASYWNRPALTSQKYLQQEDPPVMSRQHSTSPQPLSVGLGLEEQEESAASTYSTTTTAVVSVPRYFYRTGDLGYIHPETHNLHLVGRIQGEEGMVKVQGVRVELGEIEAALIDRRWSPTSSSSSSSSSNVSLFPIVTQCLARVAPLAIEQTLSTNTPPTTNNNNVTTTAIHAFCVLSDTCWKELVGGDYFPLEKPPNSGDPSRPWGVLITGGAILSLLRARCLAKLKPAGIPSAFVIIPKLPISPTGKLDRRQLPLLKDCVSLHFVLYDLGNDKAARSHEGHCPQRLLSEYGLAGGIVSETIIDCLNLQPCQQEMVTSLATFSMLGGDSLAATRVIRALYAYHNGVHNTRFLGGQFGGDFGEDGSFDVIHLLRARTLGDYVDLLDRKCLCQPTSSSQHGEGGSNELDSPEKLVEVDAIDDQVSSPTQNVLPAEAEFDDEKSQLQSDLYEALMQALTSGQSSMAMALLEVGADPTYGDHGGRLGKISGGRMEQKAVFRSTPLHLACIKGDSSLVENLLERKARYNIPDASGLYPLNLAASGVDGEESTPEEDQRRLTCVRALLTAGAPIAMRDGNKQSLLHSAARAGHCRILMHVLDVWKEQMGQSLYTKQAKQFFNGTDRWLRTPVHWAVLNGRVEALKTLLVIGCDPDPPKPKVNIRSSAAVESPTEMAIRLYGETPSGGPGEEILGLLKGDHVYG